MILPPLPDFAQNASVAGREFAFSEGVVEGQECHYCDGYYHGDSDYPYEDWPYNPDSDDWPWNWPFPTPDPDDEDGYVPFPTSEPDNNDTPNQYDPEYVPLPTPPPVDLPPEETDVPGSDGEGDDY